MPLRHSQLRGADGIHPRVLRELLEELTKPLSTTDHQSWLTEPGPGDWGLANVTLTGRVRRTIWTCQPDLGVGEGYGTDCIECSHTVWTEQPRIRPSQNGLRKGRSCLTNLASFYDQVTYLVDEGKVVDNAYLDYSKAFGTVSHSTLLGSLALCYGLTDMVCLIKGWTH